MPRTLTPRPGTPHGMRSRPATDARKSTSGANGSGTGHAGSPSTLRPHHHSMRLPVVRQGNGLRVERPPIERHLLIPPPRAVRLLDDDLVDARAKPVRHGEFPPPFRNPRIHAYRLPPLGKAEDRLQSDAVHPAR